MARMVLSTLLH